MARGGARSGAGAKSKWKHGKTKTIRVPEILADNVLEYAKRLDSSISLEILSSSESIKTISISKPCLNLAGISIYRLHGKSFVFIEDLIKLGYEVKPLKLYTAVLSELNNVAFKKN
ncbi:hypothetical protein H6G36_30550 [Anabaena minutissima FACHB-250]|nr:hypothetical protein [Anabaena minutissima FACHB-250]